MGTTAGGLTFYDEQFETGVWLGLTQFLDAFNAASAGTISLTSGARKGRKPVEAFWDDIAGLVQRRAPSGTSTLTPGAFADSEHRSIKLFRSAPVTMTRQAFIDRGMDTAEGTRLYGQQLGQAQAQNYLNTAISALVGGITAVGSTAISDLSTSPAGSATLTHGALNTALGKFGDQRSALRAMVVPSVPLTGLIGQAFSQQVIAFQVGGTTIANGMIPTLGLRTINTDSSALEEAESSSLGSTAATNYNTLLLAPGAIQVKTGLSNSAFGFITGDGSTTSENQKWLLSTEWEFEITLKGVSYKSGSDDNPTDAQLAAGSNWELVASDRKLGPGVLVKTDG
jgi:hypothetical protein